MKFSPMPCMTLNAAPSATTRPRSRRTLSELFGPDSRCDDVDGASAGSAHDAGGAATEALSNMTGTAPSETRLRRGASAIAVDRPGCRGLSRGQSRVPQDRDELVFRRTGLTG